MESWDRFKHIKKASDLFLVRTLPFNLLKGVSKEFNYAGAFTHKMSFSWASLCLKKMAEFGLVRVVTPSKEELKARCMRKDKRRKYYQITEKGLAVLKSLEALI